MITINADTPLGELVAATSMEHPSPAHRQALENYLAAHGHAELARIGNLATHAQTSLITRSFPQYSIGLAVTHHCAEMMANLNYKDASPMEQLIIQNVVLCWLRLYSCELHYEAAVADNPTTVQIEFWEKRLSASQRRHLRAVETLARVRRLLKDPPASPAFNLLLKQQITNNR